MSFLPEDYDGNIEYKLFFDIRNKTKVEKYTTQLNFRINEGHGTALYIIGIFDDGAGQNGAFLDAQTLRQRACSHVAHDDLDGNDLNGFY